MKQVLRLKLRMQQKLVEEILQMAHQILLDAYGPSVAIFPESLSDDSVRVLITR